MNRKCYLNYAIEDNEISYSYDNQIPLVMLHSFVFISTWPNTSFKRLRFPVKTRMPKVNNIFIIIVNFWWFFRLPPERSCSAAGSGDSGGSSKIFHKIFIF